MKGRANSSYKAGKLQLCNKFKENDKRMRGCTTQEEEIKQEKQEIKTLCDHLGRGMLTPWEEEGSINNHSTH